MCDIRNEVTSILKYRLFFTFRRKLVAVQLRPRIQRNNWFLVTLDRSSCVAGDLHQHFLWVYCVQFIFISYAWFGILR